MRKIQQTHNVTMPRRGSRLGGVRGGYEPRIYKRKKGRNICALIFKYPNPVMLWGRILSG